MGTMKNATLAVALFVLASLPVRAQLDTWGTAVFNSAPEAYAFAGQHTDEDESLIARVVLRTDEFRPHYIVFFTSVQPAPQSPVNVTVLQDSGNAMWLYFGIVGVAEPKGVISYGNRWLLWWVARPFDQSARR